MNRRLIAAGLQIVMALALVHDAGSAAKIKWVAFKSNLLNLQVSVPSDWSPTKIPNALAFRYSDELGATAGIGILKSTQSGTTIEEAADQQFEKEGNPADWTRSPARVGGMPAIKIVGLSPKNPEMKVVHYYVETSRGIYIIQCQAPAPGWDTFGPIFSTILSKIVFYE